MKKNKITIYVFLGLFFLSLVFIIFSFAYLSIENISAQGLKSKLIEFQEKEKEILVLEKSHNEWQVIDKSYAQFKDNFLIQYANIPGFRDELLSLFRKNYLNYTDFNFQLKYLPDVSDIGRVKINFFLSGSYESIKRFVFEIENKNKIVFIKGLSLNKINSGIMVKFSMEAYFAK